VYLLTFDARPPPTTVYVDCEPVTTQSTPTNMTSTFRTSLNITRKVFPEPSPEVCFAFMSCRRHHLLSKSLRTVITVMEAEGVPYELAVVEQCTPFQVVYDNILTQFQIEHFAFKEWNTGMGYGLNTLFFGLCTTRYVVSMEDDWKWGAPKGWMTAAIDVLNYHNELYLLPKEEKEKKDIYTGPVIGIFTVSWNRYYSTEILSTPSGSKYRISDPDKKKLD